ncbi:MAG: VRR-NUC domain-containing protein [Pseudonocardia sp.]|nr:VRR-NUC domain-containing protein [Pseudonocardia sp.]
MLGGMPVHEWECPSCDRRSITREVVPLARPHVCAGRMGLRLPMVPAGSLARHVVREREDYIGGELVQLTPETGRPVMAVETQFPNGRVDAVVYAPTAIAHGRTS